MSKEVGIVKKQSNRPYIDKLYVVLKCVKLVLAVVKNLLDLLF